MIRSLTLFLLIGTGLCSDRTDRLVDEVVTAIKTPLNPSPGLDDLKLGWEWRHWLLFHQTANLTCLWGRVYPLEKLAREDHATESPGSPRNVGVKLTASGLGYRYDSCVLIVDGKQVEAEPIWGELPDNLFDLSMSVSSTPAGCNAVVGSLQMISPALTFNPDNKIVKMLESQGVIDELMETLRFGIQEAVNQALGEVVGQTFPLKETC